MDSIELEHLLQEGDAFFNHNEFNMENISASCESISGRKKFNDLSPDKDFHLYVCFCEEDYNEVKPICIRLEECFGLKCMIFKRDFPQAGFIEEMCKNALQKCEKVLIFLSPNSNRSFWCTLEIRHASMDTFNDVNSCKMIVVELSPVEKPFCLAGIKHIDPTETEDVAASIHEAFYLSEITNELQEKNRKALAERKLIANGTVIFSDTLKPKHRKLIYGWRTFAPVLEYCDFSRLVPKHQLGPELMNHYNAVYEVLKSHALLRFYPVLQGKFYPWFASLNVSLFVLFFFLGCAFSSVAMHKKNDVSNVTYVSGVLVSLSLLPITRTILWISKKIVLRSVKSIIWKKNLSFYKKSLCFIVLDDDEEKIDVVRYETRDCQEYLYELLKSMHPDVSDEENQSEAGSKIENLLHEMYLKRQLNKLEESQFSLCNTNRHNTVGKSACLCQRLQRDVIQTLITTEA